MCWNKMVVPFSGLSAVAVLLTVDTATAALATKMEPSINEPVAVGVVFGPAKKKSAHKSMNFVAHERAKKYRLKHLSRLTFLRRKKNEINVSC